MRKVIRTDVDSFGTAFLDYHNTGEEATMEIIREDDGHTEDMLVSIYFQPIEKWSKCSQALTTWIEGRVLDVGIGAGRLALHLQEKGYEVVGIDVSPGAVEVCKARGVKDVRLHDIIDNPFIDEKFDSICLFGMNLGIAGLEENRKPFLESLKSMLNPEGRIIGTQVNWERTKKQQHIAFQDAMKKAGKFPVEMVLTIKYKDLQETFGWCLTSQRELRVFADEIGLDVEAIIDAGDMYGYVLRNPI